MVCYDGFLQGFHTPLVIIISSHCPCVLNIGFRVNRKRTHLFCCSIHPESISMLQSLSKGECDDSGLLPKVVIVRGFKSAREQLYFEEEEEAEEEEEEEEAEGEEEGKLDSSST
jgi:hypothetical protein